MNKPREDDYFESSDISLVTALCCYGYKIETIKKPQFSNKAIFLIKQAKGLDRLIEGFWAHELQVDPLLYFNYLKETKTRLYQ